MRIGLVTDTYVPQVNGVTTIVRRSALALSAAGHDVAVVAPRYPGPAPGGGLPELRVRSLPFPPYPAIRLSLPPRGAVPRFLDDFVPDVVHVHTEGTLGSVGRRYALKRGIPLVTSFHTDFPRYTRHYGVAPLAPAVWKWLTWFHGPAAMTLTPGASLRDELERRFGHATLWGRCIDTREFHPSRRNMGWRRWLAGGDDTTIVLHVGRLAPEKGLDVLIESWKVAHEHLGQRATFVVAGEGPLRSRVTQHLPFVRELGFLPRHQLATLYASADLCVLPSHTETCGLVALEAMASGIPVVAADAGGLRESVTERNGILVTPNDVFGFAMAIENLVRDSARRFTLAAAARERALERDSAREDAELIELYTRLATASEGVPACAA